MAPQVRATYRAGSQATVENGRVVIGAEELATQARTNFGEGNFDMKCLGEYLGKPGDGGLVLADATVEEDTACIIFLGGNLMRVVRPRLYEVSPDRLVLTDADEVTIQSDEGILLRVAKEGSDIVATVAIYRGRQLVRTAQRAPMLELVRAL